MHRTRSLARTLPLALTAMMLASTAGAVLADTAPAAPASISTVLPTEWKRWNGRYYRLEADGHLSCYNDGSWRSDCTASFPDPAKQKPLSCNSLSWRDKQNRKVTGYQEVGHWCNTAYANLFAEWVSYQPLGHDVELATGPRGDVMCKSIDGTNCLPSGSAIPSSTHIEPLVCGRALRQKVGGTSTGYDDPEHWCASPAIVSHVSRPDPHYLRASDEYLRHGFGVMPQVTYSDLTPPWSADEEPAWIARLRRPRLTHVATLATVTLTLTGNDPTGLDIDESTGFPTNDSGRDFEFAQSGSFGLDNGSNARFDAEGKFTVGLQMTHEGRMVGFSNPGWASSRTTAGQTVELRRAGGQPWMRSPAESWWRTDGRVSRNGLSIGSSIKAGDGTQDSLFLVTEMFMTKRRKIPAL